MRIMLTTKDNPFSPFKDFDNWFRFDVEKGYHSSAYLARIAKTSESFTDKENDEEILLDVNWYLNNGYITDEDFLKSHCELPIMEGL